MVNFHSFSPSTTFITLPSQPSSVQLSYTQTQAILTEMHCCVEKSCLYDVMKTLEQSVENGSSSMGGTEYYYFYNI